MDRALVYETSYEGSSPSEDANVLVAQKEERWSPKPGAQVRFLPRTLMRGGVLGHSGFISRRTGAVPAIAPILARSWRPPVFHTDGNPVRFRASGPTCPRSPTGRRRMAKDHDSVGSSPTVGTDMQG